MTNVLVIDDEPDYQRTLRRLLKRIGLEVLTASTIREGIAVAKDGSPHLVLLDWNLPDGTGQDFVDWMTVSGLTVPLLIQTGFLTASARAVPGAVFMEKPYGVGQLIGEVERIRARSSSVIAGRQTDIL